MDQLPPPSPPPSRSNPNPRFVTAATAAARPAPRRYPKPPSFIKRTLQFCFLPESWAQAARYPTYVTLIPLLVVIVIANMIAAASQGVRQWEAWLAFQQSYDKNYPPMQLSSDGVLSVQGELKAPVRLPALGRTIVIDPTGKTDPQTLSWGPSGAWAFISDKEIYYARNGPDDYGYQPLVHEPITARAYGMFELPPQGQTKRIDGAAIGEFLWNRFPIVILGAIFWGLFMAIGEAVWATLVIFLLTPLIMTVASIRRENEDGTRGKFVLLPRRAAVRMTAALCIPLALVSAILRGAGIFPAVQIGALASSMLWLAAAAGLAVWTAFIAREIFGSTRAAR